jgi:hypothetical protein
MKSIAATAPLVILLGHIAGQVVAAELGIQHTGGKIILSWPQPLTNDLYLEMTRDLSDAASWRPVTEAPSTIPGACVVTNDATGPARFYRLHAWEVLFDGTSVASWRGYQQMSCPDTNSWIVTTNGELQTVPSRTPVDLITTNQYADFELLWEWNGSYSGVAYRATEVYPAAVLSGPTYQLANDPPGLLPTSCLGAVWQLIAPTNKTYLPGQWNSCRLIVQSNHVEHWLNSARVVAYELNSPEFAVLVTNNPTFRQYPEFGKARAGHIALRNDANVGFFRNIRIRRLPPD